MTIRQTLTVIDSGVLQSLTFAISGPIGQWPYHPKLRDLFDMLMGAGFSMTPSKPPSGKTEVYNWGEITWLAPLKEDWVCCLRLDEEALAHPAVLIAADTLSEP